MLGMNSGEIGLNSWTSVAILLSWCKLCPFQKSLRPHSSSQTSTRRAQGWENNGLAAHKFRTRQNRRNEPLPVANQLSTSTTIETVLHQLGRQQKMQIG